MRWPLTIYTARGIPEGAAACARGPLILIRPEKRDDAGLYAHELTHVKQWLRTLGLHSLLYLLDDSYRLDAEIEAYRVQARHYADDRRPLFARYIATRYDIDISAEAALLYLMQEPK